MKCDSVTVMKVNLISRIGGVVLRGVGVVALGLTLHPPHLPPPYPLLQLVAEVLLPALYLLLDWYWLILDSVSLLR